MNSRVNKPIEILLIEDNEGDILLTRKAFEQGKISNHLSIARDGKEGVDFLLKQGKYTDVEVPTPDLILLDLNMPKMNGIEFLDYIKNIEQFKKIPVIVLTTSDSDEDVIKSYNLHASSYIKKPVDFNQFVEIIRNLQNYWFNIVKLPPR